MCGDGFATVLSNFTDMYQCLLYIGPHLQSSNENIHTICRMRSYTLAIRYSNGFMNPYKPAGVNQTRSFKWTDGYCQNRGPLKWFRITCVIFIDWNYIQKQNSRFQKESSFHQSIIKITSKFEQNQAKNVISKTIHYKLFSLFDKCSNSYNINKQYI